MTASPWPRRLAIAGIALSILAAYGDSLRNQWVYPHIADITANPSIRRLWSPWRALNPPTTNGLTVGGRPVLNLSLAVNYALGGTAVEGYHAVNLLIHILAALTLFGIVRRTYPRWSALTSTRCSTQRPDQPVEGNALHLDPACFFAFAVAFIWSLHPLQTEAVTYVIERAESLMGLFYLLTLYCFIRSVESPATSARWATLAILFCLLGMGTKEVMVSVPLVVLLYDRTFICGGFRRALRNRRWVYGGMASTWLLLGYLALSAGDRGGTAGFGSAISWWTYAQTQFRTVVDYLRLAIWPHPLMFDRGTQWAKGPGEVAPYAVAVAGLLAATGVGLWRRTAAGMFGASFFAILATTSVVPVFVQTMAEHRMYLPLAPVTVAGVWTIRAGLPRIGAAKIQLAVFLLLGLALGAVTAVRNRDYRNNLTLWSLTARQNPSLPRAHYYLGLAWEDAGRLADSIRELEKARDLNPTFAENHFRLGFVLIKSGRTAEGIPELESAIRLKPDFPEAEANLSGALAGLGRLPEAIAHYEAAVRQEPNNAKSRFNLGTLLIRSGRISEAIACYTEAVRVDPGYGRAQLSLGTALFAAGRVPEGLAHLERAAELLPHSSEARDNLGRALEAAGREAEARAELEAAERLRSAGH